MAEVAWCIHLLSHQHGTQVATSTTAGLLHALITMRQGPGGSDSIVSTWVGEAYLRGGPWAEKRGSGAGHSRVTVFTAGS